MRCGNGQACPIISLNLFLVNGSNVCLVFDEDSLADFCQVGKASAVDQGNGSGLVRACSVVVEIEIVLAETLVVPFEQIFSHCGVVHPVGKDFRL